MAEIATTSFKCAQCPNAYALKHSLLYHIRRIHNGAKYTFSSHETVYTCELCSKTCKGNKSYQSHMKRHDPSYKFERHRSELEIHECTLCDFVGTKKNYRDHLKMVHTPEEQIVYRMFFCPT